MPTILPTPAPTRRRGFTLIEVLLAISIAAAILLVVLFFYRQSEDLRANLLQATSRISAARLIMQRLTQELGAARVSATMPQGFTGGGDNLRFVKLDFPQASAWTLQTNMFAAPPASPSPFHLVSYSLVQTTTNNPGAGSGLLRSERAWSGKVATFGLTNEDDTLPTQGTTGATNGMAIEQLQYLRFRYYDGTNWLDSWSAPQLPIGVEVSLGVDPLPPEMAPEDYPFEVYRRVIFLPGAAASLAQAGPEAKEGP